MIGGRHCAVPVRRGRVETAAAFTLIELLVVIGLIALFSGAMALAIAGRGSDGAALANAQNIVVSMVGATRAQAVLNQTNARLIVYATQPPSSTADASKYLRALQVVRQDPNNTNIWIAAGDPVILPLPICVVPPSPVPTNHLNAGVSWNNNVQTGPVSTLVTLTSFNYRGQASANATQFFGVQSQNGRVHYLEFGPDGTVVSNNTGAPTKIALSTAVLGGNVLPRFDNANTVRGLFVRRSGSISLVDSATGF